MVHKLELKRPKAIAILPDERAAHQKRLPGAHVRAGEKFWITGMVRSI